jgi:hypothetical protein
MPPKRPNKAAGRNPQVAMRSKMKQHITPVKRHLALHETFIGPPMEADAAEIDVPVRKPAKRKLITTLALTIDTCRWPFGDPAEPDFHYCGERPLAGQPYCDKHDAQSYHGARRKKTA